MATVTDKNIITFRQTILQWFEINGRHFPWRQNGLSEFEIVIAEILLHRTKAETVSNFFRKFTMEFPGWSSLANAELEHIEISLRPVGLHRQSERRLKSLAIEMVFRNGQLPRSRVELENIPFMGQYIANAVELLIRGKDAPLVDENMARVLERYFGERHLADIRYDSCLQDLALRIVSTNRSKRLTGQFSISPHLSAKHGP